MTALVKTQGNLDSLGRVEYFAGDFAPFGYSVADGSILPINGNEALFSKLGTTYGGDGRRTFALPDLRGRTAVGTGAGVTLGEQIGSPSVTLNAANLPAHTHQTATGPSTSTGLFGPTSFTNRQPGLGLDFEILTTGVFPSSTGEVVPVADQTPLPAGTSRPLNSDGEEGMLGFVALDAALFGAERGTTNASGQLLPISQNTALFSILGDNYGGDAQTNFGLPNIDGRIVTGAGTGPGLTERGVSQLSGTETSVLSEATMPAHSHSDPDHTDTDPSGGGLPISNLEPEITLNYIIATSGLFPTTTGRSLLPDSFGIDPYLGQVALFAGHFAPRGWTIADGDLLSTASNPALFSLLGTAYGGDGQRTFALPDLRGRTVVGSGTATWGETFRVGDRFGTESLLLTANNLPSHSHQIERMQIAPVPLPPAGLLMAFGLSALGLFGRKRR